MLWYALHTSIGSEEAAAQSLQGRVDSAGRRTAFGRIVAPERSGSEEYPGMLLIEMVLDDETRELVLGTPGIAGFVGGDHEPSSVPQSEALRLVETVRGQRERVELPGFRPDEEHH